MLEGTSERSPRATACTEQVQKDQIAQIPTQLGEAVLIIVVVLSVVGRPRLFSITKSSKRSGFLHVTRF